MIHIQSGSASCHLLASIWQSASVQPYLRAFRLFHDTAASMATPTNGRHAFGADTLRQTDVNVSVCVCCLHCQCLCQCLFHSVSEFRSISMSMSLCVGVCVRVCAGVYECLPVFKMIVTLEVTLSFTQILTKSPVLTLSLSLLGPVPESVL